MGSIYFYKLHVSKTNNNMIMNMMIPGPKVMIDDKCKDYTFAKEPVHGRGDILLENVALISMTYCEECVDSNNSPAI